MSAYPADNLLPAPFEFGAPLRFTTWRDYQDLAVCAGIESTARFVVQSMPTGSGKSLCYITQALATGVRTCILTSTKGLQNQIVRDFGSCGVVDIRGKDNYACLDDQHPASCGFRHNPKDPECEYYRALRAAQNSPLVVTNYSYWMHSMKYTREIQLLGAFDLLVLDEAHNAPNELASFLGFELSRYETHRVFGEELPEFATLPQWSIWADKHIETLEDIVERESAELMVALRKLVEIDGTDGGDPEPFDYLREWHRQGKGDLPKHINTILRFLRSCESLRYTLLKMGNLRPDEWVFERDRDALVTFDIINPAPYAERELFSYTEFYSSPVTSGRQRVRTPVPKVLLVSATVRPKTCELLGIDPSSDSLDFQEYPHTFPKAGRMVTYVPTVRMRYDTPPGDLKIWLSRIDNVIRSRVDRKGIIHTVSYARRDYVMTNSKYAELMISHGGAKERDEVIARFKASTEPVVLVSPSVATGFDFPYSCCEYQIIGKVPWPSTQSKIMKARTENDPDYMHYIAMQEIVQAAGRGTRAPDDHCECFTPDTRILTNDLQWVEAESLQAGDKLLAFDEHGHGRVNPRRWRWSDVIAKTTRRAACYRVVFEDGQLIASTEHPWLCLRRGSTIGWLKTTELRLGTKLFRLLTPWKSGSTFEEGWLSGFYDGEGCLVQRLGKRNPNVSRVMLVQNSGDALAQSLFILDTLGFQYAVHPHPHANSNKLWAVWSKGGHAELLRFLGQIRPVRLLDKFTSSTRNEKITAISYPKILAIERVPDQWVTSLQTSTGTYVAEGLGAHNCFVLDDQFWWWIWKYQHFAPEWFRECIRKSVTIPAPPPSLLAQLTP